MFAAKRANAHSGRPNRKPSNPRLPSPASCAPTSYTVVGIPIGPVGVNVSVGSISSEGRRRGTSAQGRRRRSVTPAPGPARLPACPREGGDPQCRTAALHRPTCSLRTNRADRHDHAETRLQNPPLRPCLGNGALPVVELLLSSAGYVQQRPDGFPDPFGCDFDIAVRKVRVTQRHLYIGVPEQPRDHRYGHAVHDCRISPM